PGVYWFNASPNTIQGVGIEDLTLDNANGSVIGAIVFMSHAYGSWMKNVRSVNSNAPADKHMWSHESTHLTIRDSYFYGSGSASDAYGVDNYDSADNLVENDIFQHLAAPELNEGCIGCVQAYNFT